MEEHVEPKEKPGSADPLHGVTLESLLNQLVAHYGWKTMAQRVPIRCFDSDPSVGSSLRFLRKTPWARKKVEALYLEMVQGMRDEG
jgi:uncharacterized protein (DUF2132 family)